MSGKCEHGLTTKECLVCASAKYGERAATLQRKPLSEKHAAIVMRAVDLLESIEGWDIRGGELRVEYGASEWDRVLRDLRALVAHGIGGDE